jgi:hypothetical protein
VLHGVVRHLVQGVCLSDTYGGSKKQYLFRCAKGHEWEATGQRVLLGGWCGRCANDAKRLSIEDARQAAHAKGGRCLSEVYVNNRTKLTWACDRGHVWRASLGGIRSGRRWCPECAHMNRITKAASKARHRYGGSLRHSKD